METIITELKPINGRKSFGGKAQIKIEKNIVTLLSYGTEICFYNTYSNVLNIVYTQKMSATTNTHLKAFKKLYNLN